MSVCMELVYYYSFLADNMVLLVLIIMLLVLAAMALQDNVHVGINAVLATDQGKQNTELAFSPNSYATYSVNINYNDDWIYTSPLPAHGQDNDTLKTQLVL